jgi:hypothetical protein
MPRRPRTPQEFMEQASRFVRARMDRELLAYGQQYGAQFSDRFTPEERNRLEGMFEGAQRVADAEDWLARSQPSGGGSTTVSGEVHDERRGAADVASGTARSGVVAVER